MGGSGRISNCEILYTFYIRNLSAFFFNLTSDVRSETCSLLSMLERRVGGERLEIRRRREEKGEEKFKKIMGGAR